MQAYMATAYAHVENFVSRARARNMRVWTDPLFNLRMAGWMSWPVSYGCGSKNRYQNGTLGSGNMDQNPAVCPSCLLLRTTPI